jgi:hypothetical protein
LKNNGSFLLWEDDKKDKETELFFQIFENKEAIIRENYKNYITKKKKEVFLI